MSKRLALPAKYFSPRSPTLRQRQQQQQQMSSARTVLAKTCNKSFVSFSPSQKPTSLLIALTPRTRLLTFHAPKPLLSSTRRTMASDSDYMAFLDKANRQRDAGSDQVSTEETSPQQLRTETVGSGVAVPDVLKTVDAFYVSDTDEPFEPVALKWAGASKGEWPRNDDFASLITGSQSTASNIADSIETLSEQSFDPRNQYSAVIKAVRAAAVASDPNIDESRVDVKIYRVEVGHSRAEYYIVALDAAGGKIVGLRAKAVES